MYPDGFVIEGLASSNQQQRNEHKEMEDPIACESQGLLEEDESKINEAVGDLNDSQIGFAPSPAQQSGVPQQQHQLPPGPIIRWERFLPVRTLKVLLVENDDSTRQVVSALLRNCSYEGKTLSHVVVTSSRIRMFLIVFNLYSFLSVGVSMLKKL